MMNCHGSNSAIISRFNTMEWCYHLLFYCLRYVTRRKGFGLQIDDLGDMLDVEYHFSDGFN